MWLGKNYSVHVKSNTRLQNLKEFPFHLSLFTRLALSMTSMTFRCRCFSTSLLADRCVFVRCFEENLFNFLCSGSSLIHQFLWVLCHFLQQIEKNSPQCEKKIFVFSSPPHMQIIKKLLNLQLSVPVVLLHKTGVHVQPAENGLDNEV